MADTFQGKKVLLMVFPFFDYGNAIATALEDLGADVHLIYNRFEVESFRSSMHWVVTLFKRIRNPFFKRKFTNQVLDQTDGRCYDYLISIGGFTAQRRLITKLKKDNPNLLTRIFFWDSFSYWRFSHLRKWFDKAFSFDPIDCGRYKDLIYLPDFYLGHQSKVSNPIYEVSHIGSAHIFARDRVVILDQLKSQLDQANISNFLMLYETNNPNSQNMIVRGLSDWRWALYRGVLKKYSHNPVVHTQRMDYANVVEIETQSRCILDIPSPKQSGVTIRALEAIAAGKKLITTNRHITTQSFYDPANISILDPKKPVIDFDFLHSDTHPVDIAYLRLDNWLKNLL